MYVMYIAEEIGSVQRMLVGTEIENLSNVAVYVLRPTFWFVPVASLSLSHLDYDGIFIHVLMSICKRYHVIF